MNPAGQLLGAHKGQVRIVLDWIQDFMSLAASILLRSETEGPESFIACTSSLGGVGWGHAKSDARCLGSTRLKNWDESCFAPNPGEAILLL